MNIITVALSDFSSLRDLKELDIGSSNEKSGALKPIGTIVLGVAAIIFLFYELLIKLTFLEL